MTNTFQPTRCIFMYCLADYVGGGTYWQMFDNSFPTTRNRIFFQALRVGMLAVHFLFVLLKGSSQESLSGSGTLKKIP